MHDQTMGTLYGVGVGPGDPELLTLKAMRLIRETDVIAVPVTGEGAESYALDLVAPLVRQERPVQRLLFPMERDVAARKARRREAARIVLDHLRAGQDVAFLTEGDPTIHSTFMNVVAELPEGIAVEIVPGVTSITAAVADAGMSLVAGDERLAVLPAVFEKDDAGLRQILRDFDTVVLLKAYRSLGRLIPLLDELGLTKCAVWVERAGHRSGRVVRDVSSLRDATGLHYLSLLIVRNPAREGDDAD